MKKSVKFMRQVKHRNAKRAVEFFTLNANFRQPYEVRAQPHRLKSNVAY